MFSSAVSTSMARVSNLFSRNEMYQEQTDLFNDDDQIWTGPNEKNDRPTMVGDKPQPWSRTEAETQAANVKALLQDQLRREKPLAEVVGDSPQLERSPPEKRRSRRKESGGGSNSAGGFDFPQDWLTPQTSPAQRSAERIDVAWPPVTSTSRSPSQAHAWPVKEPRSQELPTPEPNWKERNVGRQESSASSGAAGQFDEAILAALSALPRHSLVDVLRRLADRRPEEVNAALCHLKDQSSPASTGAGTALLSPPKSEVTRGTASPASALSPSPQMAVAEAVAEAADAAAGSGWPESDVWPSSFAPVRSDPWPQVTPLAWPEANR